MYPCAGFFPEDELRSDCESEDAKRRRERKEALRKLRQDERHKLKSRMVTRVGLLYPETKSAYEWRRLDRKRKYYVPRLLEPQSEIKPKQKPQQKRGYPGFFTEEQISQFKQQRNEELKRKRAEREQNRKSNRKDK